MTSIAPILCIGSVLWDTVGRSMRVLEAGHDVPGRISRIPGGVAMNIAMALRTHDVPVSLLSALGDDSAGHELLMEANVRGMETGFVHISKDHPTDQYMAIEGTNGLIAAIADAHSLEAQTDEVIAPLRDGRIGSRIAPFSGMMICEGNLPSDTLAYMSSAAEFRAADIRLAAASSGKAERLKPFFGHGKATVYLNLTEANILLGLKLKNTAVAARRLVATGLYRAVVTDGSNPVSVVTTDSIWRQMPPVVKVLRVTGAGDVFMASHIAAELRGKMAQEALDFALTHTATYISTEDPL